MKVHSMRIFAIDDRINNLFSQLHYELGPGSLERVKSWNFFGTKNWMREWILGSFWSPKQVKSKSKSHLPHTKFLKFIILHSTLTFLSLTQTTFFDTRKKLLRCVTSELSLIHRNLKVFFWIFLFKTQNIRRNTYTISKI